MIRTTHRLLRARLNHRSLPARSHSRHVLRSCQYLGDHIQTTTDTPQADAYIVGATNPEWWMKDSTQTLLSLNKPIYIHLDQPGHYIDKLQTLTRQNITGFLLSNFASEEEVYEIDAKLRAIEKEDKSRHGYELISVITNDTIERVEAIAKVARHAALVAQLCLETQSGLKFSFPLITAASVNGLVPLYTAQPEPRLTTTQTDDYDYRLYIGQCLDAKRTGFQGMITRNTSESILANETFKVSGNEVKMAQSIVDQQEKGMKTYQRSSNDRPVQIGTAQSVWAKRTLAQAVPQASFSTTEGTRRVHKRHGEEDLSRIRVGETIGCYLETTISHAHLATWDSSFYPNQKVTTSTKFCNELGLKERLVPYDVLMHLCMGGAVARLTEKCRVHLGSYNAVQYRPLYVGDTINIHYRIKSINPTQAGFDVVSSEHEAVNQDGELIMSIEKRTMFDKSSFSEEVVEPQPEGNTDRVLKNHIIQNYRGMSNPPPVIQHSTGDVFVHRFVKVFGRSETHALTSQFRFCNDFHRDVTRFREEDILVPGPSVATAAMSNLLMDYGEILYQECLNSTLLNKTNMEDMISTISCVLDRQDVPGNNHLEELTLKIFGVLNADPAELEDVNIPDTVITEKQLRPNQMEKAFADSCPSLFHRVASVEVRKILRDKSTLQQSQTVTEANL